MEVEGNLLDTLSEGDRVCLFAAGRKRSVTEFGWAAIAAQTAALYAELVTRV